jgi:hypothetical protein
LIDAGHEAEEARCNPGRFHRRHDLLHFCFLGNVGGNADNHLARCGGNLLCCLDDAGVDVDQNQ